jgi:hypothetical protein
LEGTLLLLTHRNLPPSKAIAIENDRRGTLPNFGLKIGIAGTVKFEGRNRELVENPTDFAVLIFPRPTFPTLLQRHESASGTKLFSFAFRPVEDWFHPSAARLRRAGLCATRFSRLSFAFFPRSEHVPRSPARLDLVRNSA